MFPRTMAAGWLGLLASAPAGAAELEPGLYEIRSKLELPHLEEVDVRKSERHCLVAAGGAGKHGFSIQSDNNPLRGCPMVDVSEAGDELSFAIRCGGSNLAKAQARYIVMGTRFRGRIDMTMGGKNMTMTEVQEGKRVGACPPLS